MSITPEHNVIYWHTLHCQEVVHKEAGKK